MRKLALDDEILLSIEKPARYIGNEVNSIMKNKNEVDIRFAMCFPDVYEIGMSHLGIQILICLTEETMFGVNASILRGQILIQLCVKREFRFLH